MGFRTKKIVMIAILLFLAGCASKTLDLVKNGDLQALNAVLEKGADLEEDYGAGWTPLITASYHGKTEIARFLLDKGANVNARTNPGKHANFTHMSALMWVSGRNHPEVAELLLEHGANVTFKCDGVNIHAGSTALEIAAQAGNKKVVELLIAKEPDLQNSITAHRAAHWALIYAKIKKDKGHQKWCDTANIILRSGAPANITWNSRKDTNLTLLFLASKDGFEDVVRELLAKDVDVSVKTGTGKTALSEAKENSHERIVKMLLDAGAKE